MAEGIKDTFWGSLAVAKAPFKGSLPELKHIEATLGGIATLVGVPTEQPRRSMKGFVNLMSGKRKGWKQLVLSEYAMKPQYVTWGAWEYIRDNGQDYAFAQRMPRNDEGKVDKNSVRAYVRRFGWQTTKP